jgi:CRISPR/Cas system-associated endonuclease/helicase Cas3
MNRLLYLLALAIVLAGLAFIGMNGPPAIFSTATVPVKTDELLTLNPN